ncbi:MAG: cytochrome c-type biogenesis protein CcmH [Chloroflexota bacterium]
MDRRLSSRRLLAVVLLALVALLLAGTVFAQDDITDDDVNDVASDLYCPVCESTPLDVCATQACADWRELIRTQLSEGASKQDVLDYFARQYGEGVLANPPRRGVSLIVLWIIPILGIALAAMLFFRFMRGLHAPSADVVMSGGSPGDSPETAAVPEKPRPAPGTTSAELDDYISRVEDELGD